MKKLLFCVIAFALCLTSCGSLGIAGNGYIIERTYDVAAFDSISLEGIGKMYLTQGPEYKVTLRCDSNLVQNIEIDSNDGRLSLSTKTKLSFFMSPTKLEYEVSAPNFSKVSIVGSGSAITRTPLVEESLDIEILGSGDFKGIVDCRDIAAVVAGSGDIYLEGRAEVFNAFIRGSGDINAKALDAAIVSVTISGSGDAIVSASKSLDATVSGSGDITYYGDPSALKKQIKGSGNITRR